MPLIVECRKPPEPPPKPKPSLCKLNVDTPEETFYSILNGYLSSGRSSMKIETSKFDKSEEEIRNVDLTSMRSDNNNKSNKDNKNVIRQLSSPSAYGERDSSYSLHSEVECRPKSEFHFGTRSECNFHRYSETSRGAKSHIQSTADSVPKEAQSLDTTPSGDQFEKSTSRRKKPKREFAFAKKFRRSGTSTTSLKSFTVDQESKEAATNVAGKPRLSRGELKYATISLPTNFVHVASGTKSGIFLGEELLLDKLHEAYGYASIKRESQNEREDRNSVRAEKETLENGQRRATTGMRIEVEEKIYEAMSESTSGRSLTPRANSSFLWSNTALSSAYKKDLDGYCDEEYDDVGLPSDYVDEVRMIWMIG